jgi:hypothetical protein
MKIRMGVGLALICGLGAMPAGAALLRVDVEERADGNRIKVFDGATGSAAYADAATMAIQVGTVAADPVGNRVFFIGNSGASQGIYRLDYTTTQVAVPTAFPPALRATHLEWDSSGTQRLVGVALATADESSRLFVVQGSVTTDLGMPETDCCTFRAGVSAFRASDDSLFLVGRRGTDVVDQLFRFTMNPLALAQAVAVPVDLTVDELNISSGGGLIGLAWSATAEATQAFTANAGLALTTLGSGMTDCCFVMAGASAVDTATNSLITLGPGTVTATPNPPRLWTFNLGSGSVMDGMAPIRGAGLFVDATPILDDSVLFLDGFE